MTCPSTPTLVFTSLTTVALTGALFVAYQQATHARNRRALAEASAEAYVAGVRDTHAELGDRLGAHLGELIDEQS